MRTTILEEGRKRQENITVNDSPESKVFGSPCAGWQGPEATEALVKLNKEKREVKPSEVGWLWAQDMYPQRWGWLSADVQSW